MTERVPGQSVSASQLEAAMPDLHGVVLPSRAILTSWRTQTIPARQAALDDSHAHWLEGKAADGAYRSMGLAGLFTDAAQPLEDLAYLATAWNGPADRRFHGQPNWVRATTYDRNMADTFWNQVHKWSDEAWELFAGMRGRDPETGEDGPILVEAMALNAPNDAEQAALDAAREATIERLRRIFSALAIDWNQFSRLLHAYKHGGLVLNPDKVRVFDHAEANGVATDRADLTGATTGDDVRETGQPPLADEALADPEDDARPRVAVDMNPALLVWQRRSSQAEIRGDLDSDPHELADYVRSTGRLALDLLDAFIESRLALFDTLVIDGEGRIVDLKPFQVPWTIWLHEQDLAREHWEILGAGPRITWVEDEDE